ncbi:hypothetical protein PSHT_04243 [Puccinia striiformis]|uniref:Protein transport protein SEC23 n=1 Tax=Puccinia striiformis TaxID=27350 RepID=A0A2S4WDE1_9BASI|nr:hypothetical protein PSHT_04243 [Puccinia striiformis]
MNFSVEDVEDRDGTRLSSVSPRIFSILFLMECVGRIKIRKYETVVPIAALYTPLKQRDDLPPVLYEPVTCKPPCRAILNPYCQIDYTTIEYTLNRPAQIPPIFLYVVDTCLDEEDLKALRAELVISLSLLPPTALVGLITFGTMRYQDYSPKQIQDMLGLGGQAMNRAPNAPMPAPAQQGTARFLLPVQQVEFSLTGILEQLQRDPWPVANDKRPQRCTGVAVSVAVGLLETTFPNTGARVMLFAGGPPSEGPGQVVSTELREPIRSHHDIDRDNVKYFKRACKFYESLAKRAAANGHAIDIFAGCLDQVGLLEMRSLANWTNGFMILSDSFTTSIFRQSFQKLFEKDDDGQLKMGFNATFDVQTTKELKVSGLIGHAVSSNKKSGCVGETEIGIGQTSAWKICSLTPRTSNAIYFEVVTPAARVFAEAGNPIIASSFDQEAAAVLMARIAVFKAEIDDSPDVLRWLDRMLIRLCQNSPIIERKNPVAFVWLMGLVSILNSCSISKKSIPSSLNNSPDETAFYRHILNAEDVNNSLVAIQPTLMSYGLDSEPSPVLLDSVSIQDNTILLLDTFFHILIFHGATIAQWRKAGYHEQEDYANLKELLQRPKDDAADLLADRFPVPRYIVCDQNGSQARFLLSKLNPSTTHASGGGMYGQQSGGSMIFTDDVSLQIFMEHLKKLAVSGSN